MNEKLKPCPFCGCQEIIIRKSPCNDFRFAICFCGASSGSKETKEEVIKSWNNRIAIRFEKTETE